jgi:beta-carotene hydroxylase
VLKYKDDWRSVAVMLAVTAVFAGQWSATSFHPGLFVLSLVMSLQVAVLAHNHHHSPMWTRPGLNLITGYWLTLFYGGPAISWRSIHNRSHHAHGNTPELDVTSTHNVGDRNDLVGLVLYLPRSMGRMVKAHQGALSAIRKKSPAKFWYHVSDLAFLYGAIAVALVIDWKKALLFLIIPQQVAITSIAHFNFFQHAHTEAGSRYNVARNFVGRVLNFYLFNSGYHTVHHLQPTLHWSKCAALHAQIAHKIDPRLNQSSFWAYWVRVIFGRMQPKLIG